MKKELPQGWCNKSFSEELDIQGGTQPPKSTFIYEAKKGYIRLLQIRDFGGKPQPTFIPYRKQLKVCEKEDILIARYGASIGRIVTGMEGAYNVALAKVIIPTNYDRLYVYYLLKSEIFQRPILTLQRSAQDGFNKDDLAQIFIPVPEKPLQKEIGLALDSLMKKVNANKLRLDKIPQILKRFRQTVLATAVNGKLTSNSVFNKVPLGDLIEDLKYGTSQKSEAKTKGVPVLRIPNIGEGKICLDDLKYSVLPEKEYAKLKLQEGDLLLIRSNGSVSLVGKAALVSEKEVGYAYAGYLIRIRCNKDLILPEYLNHVLASYDIRMQIEMTARSTSGINNINSDEVRSLKIPITTIKEQKDIVKNINELFAFSDKIEKRYNQAIQLIDKLPQSILAKAFKGELLMSNNLTETISSVKRIRVGKPKIEKVGKKAGKKISKKLQPKVFTLKTTDLHAGIIAKVIDAHEQNSLHKEKLGHVKVEKIGHLIEYHLGIDLGRVPKKLAAGPADFPHLKKVEHRAKLKGWFIPLKIKDQLGYSYKRSRNFKTLLGTVNSELKTDNASVDKLIKLFLPMNKEQAEVVATVYAAWNNFLIDGKKPSDEQIVKEARENWTKEKLKIDREKFFKSLKWLRTKNIIPTGAGKKVI